MNQEPASTFYVLLPSIIMQRAKFLGACISPYRFIQNLASAAILKFINHTNRLFAERKVLHFGYFSLWGKTKDLIRTTSFGAGPSSAHLFYRRKNDIKSSSFPLILIDFLFKLKAVITNCCVYSV